MSRIDIDATHHHIKILIREILKISEKQSSYQLLFVKEIPSSNSELGNFYLVSFPLIIPTMYLMEAYTFS